MLRIFFKKANENVFRLIISSISLALALFLPLMLFTLGMNSFDIMKSWFDEYPEYRFIYLETENLLPREIETASQSRVASASKQVGYELFVGEYDFSGSDIVKYISGSADIIPGGKLLTELAQFTTNAVFIGKSVLAKKGIDGNLLIGEKVRINGSDEYFVSGIYDDSKMIYPIHFILISEEEEACEVQIIEAAETSKVKDICLFYSEKGYETISYQGEIDKINNKFLVIKAVLALMIFLASVAASLILCSALRMFISESKFFLIMIKVMGYQKKHLFMFFEEKMLPILSISLLIDIMLYMFVPRGIVWYLERQDVAQIYGYELEGLLQQRIMAFFVVFGIQLILTIVISVIAITHFEKNHEYSVLSEAEQ